MNKISRHNASINEVYWKDVRDDVSAVNPELAKKIDALNPGKKFPLFKAKYPFGATISREGVLYLPTSSGDVQSIHSPSVSAKILQHLKRRDFPTILMLKNSAEMFYEMPDRIISEYMLRPGRFFGLWERFDPPEDNYAQLVWSLVSGARTLYLLPKITNVTGHKALRKKHGVAALIPKNYPDQWNVFVKISNSQAFEEEWCSEMLFFSDKWFEASQKNSSWKDFYTFLLQTAWEDSRYWRSRGRFDVHWENFIYEVMDKNIKPNLYLSCIVKQIILTGIGCLPGLTIATDETTAPIKLLQETYIKDYKLRNYNPLFMHPHNFSFEDDVPTYYSLQYPNLFETVPIVQTLPSVLSSIPEISSLLKAFQEKIEIDHSAKETLIHRFFRDVELDYFHYREEKRNGIQSTEKMPEGDKRLLIYPSKSKNNIFPSTSNLINGCVRFKNSEVDPLFRTRG